MLESSSAQNDAFVLGCGLSIKTCFRGSEIHKAITTKDTEFKKLSIDMHRKVETNMH